MVVFVHAWQPIIRRGMLLMNYAARGLLALFLISISGLQADSADPNAKKPQSDQERMEGVWIFVTLTEKQEDRMFLSGGSVALRVGGKTTNGKVALDDTKTPKHIDITFREEKDRALRLRGIFQFLEGDLLAICMGEFDGPRPTELKAAEKQNTMLFVRAKQEIPPGHYTTLVNGERWALDLNDRGVMRLKRKGETVFDGAFTSSKTEIEVVDLKDPRAGLEHLNTGKYRWTMDGRNLSFNKIDDDCKDRATAMTGNTWIRTE